VARATGAELLHNGSFSSGAQDWQTLSSGITATFGIDTTIFHTAPSAARIDAQSVSPAGSFKLDQPGIPIHQGRGYTLGFWARASVAQDLLVFLDCPACPHGRALDDRRLRLDTSWRRFAVPFVAGGSGEAGLNLFVEAPGSVWIDDVSLREGDTSVYRRDFDRGIVLLNYTATPRTVTLGRTYYRLHIAGSPVFDGAAVTRETIPPSDARILLTTPPSTPATSAQP
jgi:hypothetical protein